MTMANAPCVRIDPFFEKAEYFFKRDWTAQITLIRLGKLVFARTSAGRAGEARSTDKIGATGATGCRRGRKCGTMSMKARHVN
jgi:hypothetical protein